MNDPYLSSSMNGGSSPKGMYVMHLLNLEREYFHVMCTPQVCPHCGAHNSSNMETATAALVASCPDRDKQRELWELYTKILEGKLPGQEQIGGSNIVTASVMTVGELIAYLSDTLEFTEKSTAAFL